MVRSAEQQQREFIGYCGESMGRHRINSDLRPAYRPLRLSELNVPQTPHRLKNRSVSRERSHRMSRGWRDPHNVRNGVRSMPRVRSVSGGSRPSTVRQVRRKGSQGHGAFAALIARVPSGGKSLVPSGPSPAPISKLRLKPVAVLLRFEFVRRRGLPKKRWGRSSFSTAESTAAKYHRAPLTRRRLPLSRLRSRRPAGIRVPR